MTDVEVIIPYWGGDPVRLVNLDWVEKALLSAGLKVTIARGGQSKGAVLWPAVRTSGADVIAVCDADVWCDGLQKAIDIVSRGRVWAKPHDFVFRLSEDSSEAFRAGCRTHPSKLQLARRAYRGVVGGGIVVGRREIFLDVPVDPRFVGWGQEDQAFGAAVWCLYGPPWTGRAPLIHLWHELEPRLNNRWGSLENRRLFERYSRATVAPSEMLQLVSEAHDALRSSQPDSHGHLSVV